MPQRTKRRGEESRWELKQKAARERRIREGEEDPGGRPGSVKLLLLLSTVSFFCRAFPSSLLPGYTSIYTNGNSESSPGGIPVLVLDPAEAVGLAPARVLAGVGAGERLWLAEASGGAAEEFMKLLLLDGPGEEPGHLQICTGGSFSPADVFLAPEFGIVSQRRRATLAWWDSQASGSPTPLMPGAELGPIWWLIVGLSCPDAALCVPMFSTALSDFSGSAP